MAGWPNGWLAGSLQQHHHYTNVAAAIPAATRALSLQCKAMYILVVESLARLGKTRLAWWGRNRRCRRRHRYCRGGSAASAADDGAYNHLYETKPSASEQKYCRNTAEFSWYYVCLVVYFPAMLENC